MLQKRIKLPSGKTIISNPQNSKKNLVKKIPKAESAKKNQNIDNNFNIIETDINSKKMQL